MAYVRVRGVDLYYEQYGSGPCVLIAHGGFGSTSKSAALGLRARDIAAQGYRVVAYDARGHGRSGYSTRPRDYHWQALAQDMLGLLDTLGLERVNICGSSMGAGTALTLAVAHPQRVQRLVLRTPPSFDGGDPQVRKRLNALVWLYRCLGSRWTARIASSALSGEEAERARAILGGQRRAAIVPAIRGLLSDELGPVAERVGELDKPVLVLTHPGDPTHPQQSGEFLRDRIPHAQLVAGESPYHWHRNPAALTAAITEFLRSETQPVSVAAGSSA